MCEYKQIINKLLNDVMWLVFYSLRDEKGYLWSRQGKLKAFLQCRSGKFLAFLLCGSAEELTTTKNEQLIQTHAHGNVFNQLFNVNKYLINFKSAIKSVIRTPAMCECACDEA